MTYRNKIITSTREKIRIILPFVHFMLTFSWHGKIFTDFGNWEYFTTIVRNDTVISAAGEQFIVYILSLIFCFLIICGLWKIIYYIADEKIKRAEVILFGIILLIGLIGGIILYPDVLGLNNDNFVNYYMARRFQPTYWQSIYTGALYAGCLMVMPHPIALFFVQWVFFLAVVCYIYLGMKDIYGDAWYKYAVLLIFLIPESFYLAIHPYRNNYYTVLVIWYAFILYFYYKKEEKNVGIKKMLCFSALSAFLMVWRSEGLLVGAGGIILFIVLMIQKLKKSKQMIKYVIILLSFTGVIFVVLHNIQKIGEKKYYGQDYMMLNTTSVLHSILNDPDANLSYAGAESDLQAIDSVMSIDVLREYGVDGYRISNWNNGSYDFCQTLASDEQANKYMKAYYNIICNNMDDYLGVQVDSFLKALGIPSRRVIYSYTGEHNVQLGSFINFQAGYGGEEINATFLTEAWKNNRERRFIQDIVCQLINTWRELIINSGINMLMHALTVLLIILIFMKELLSLIEKNKAVLRAIPYIIACLTIIGELFAIMLFMPTERPEYLYPMLYAGYSLIYIYFIENILNTGKRLHLLKGEDR